MDRPMMGMRREVRGAVDRPMMGMRREVRGMLSATMRRKTVKARRTEMPSEIFSPPSGGRQKTIMTSTDRSEQGVMMFIT